MAKVRMDAEAYRRPLENSRAVMAPKLTPTSAAPPHRPDPAAPTRASPKGALSSKMTAPASTAASKKCMPASAPSNRAEVDSFTRPAR